MDTTKRTVRIISLRPEQANDDSLENALRNAGHKVTVLSSTEPAFSLVSSSWPDVVMFDPISQFGMSGSIQRLRSSFDGLIIAAGHIPDPTITSMLEELGIANFADTAGKLRVLVDNAPIRKTVSAVNGFEKTRGLPKRVSLQKLDRLPIPVSDSFCLGSQLTLRQHPRFQSSQRQLDSPLAVTPNAELCPLSSFRRYEILQIASP